MTRCPVPGCDHPDGTQCVLADCPGRPRAYTGPYPIRNHRTMAEVMLSERIDTSHTRMIGK